MKSRFFAATIISFLVIVSTKHVYFRDNYAIIEYLSDFVKDILHIIGWNTTGVLLVSKEIAHVLVFYGNYKLTLTIILVSFSNALGIERLSGFIADTKTCKK